MPPTERRGRVHTSSITVVVLEEDHYKEVEIYPSEVNVEYTRDSGPGGQHRNKTESCVVLTHYTTGIKVKNANSSDQHKNKREAWKELTKRVNNFYRYGKLEDEKQIRRDQIGNGNRGDKRRTYRCQDGYVVDHISGRRAKLKSILRGNLELLH